MSTWQPHRQVREDKGKVKRRRLHSRVRNVWVSIFVIRLVGIVVKTADAKGARWSASTPFLRPRAPSSAILPRTSSEDTWWLFAANPPWVRGTLDLLQKRPHGCSASVKEWAHFLTASQQRAGLFASPEITVSAIVGCLWRIVFRQSNGLHL